MEDKLVLGGKEFNSCFILGSGKYNINQGSSRTGRCRNHYPGFKKGKYPGKGKYFRSYPGRSHTASQYFRCQKCRRSGAYCQTEQGYGLWGFCKS